MRITSGVVARVAEWATEVTGGAFAYHGHGTDLGNGARYLDAIATQVWLGRHGVREATAYYVNAGQQWAELAGADVPGWVSEVLTEVSGGQPPSVREWAERGRVDARHKYDTRGERADKSEE
jgi:hypothetical protein